MNATQQAHPAGDPDARYEVAAMFQDGEVFTVERMAFGLGLFDDETPALVARRIGDDEWLTLGGDGDFVAVHGAHQQDGDHR